MNLRHVAPLLFLTGCLSLDALQRESPAQLRYVLDVRRPAGESALGEETLLVRRFQAATDANSRPFVYRVSEHRVEVDFYNELLVPPATALEEAAVGWLRSAGLFARVERPGARRETDFELIGDLTEWWIDLRDPAAPRAVAGIMVTLVKSDGSEVVWHRSLRAAERCEARTPEAFVAGWSRAVAAVLAEAESGIRAVIGGVREVDADLR